MIYLAVVEPDEPKTRAVVLAEQLAAMGLTAPPEFEVGANGKPRLIAGEPVGFSYTHIRTKQNPFGLMALIEDQDIGVDGEPWPLQAADPAFLQTIATREDEQALAALGADGRDAGIGLWVIKEAALKCIGEVMIDPRNVAVRPIGNNLFQIAQSALATALRPPIHVGVYKLSLQLMPAHLCLVALAVSAASQFEVANMNNVVFWTEHWLLRH